MDPHSTAAPGDAQDAHRPSATNDKAPVTPRRGAAVEGMAAPKREPSRSRAAQAGPATREVGAVASGAGIAGMAGTEDATRPELAQTSLGTFE